PRRALPTSLTAAVIAAAAVLWRRLHVRRQTAESDARAAGSAGEEPHTSRAGGGGRPLQRAECRQDRFSGSATVIPADARATAARSQRRRIFRRLGSQRRRLAIRQLFRRMYVPARAPRTARQGRLSLHG